MGSALSVSVSLATQRQRGTLIRTGLAPFAAASGSRSEPSSSTRARAMSSRMHIGQKSRRVVCWRAAHRAMALSGKNRSSRLQSSVSVLPRRRMPISIWSWGRRIGDGSNRLRAALSENGFSVQGGCRYPRHRDFASGWTISKAIATQALDQEIDASLGSDGFLPPCALLQKPDYAGAVSSTGVCRRGRRPSARPLRSLTPGRRGLRGRGARGSRRSAAAHDRIGADIDIGVAALYLAETLGQHALRQ